MEFIEFKNVRGQRLVGELDWQAGEPLVVCTHGLQSSRQATKLQALAEALRKQKIGSLRFDFAGRGDSEGKFFDVTYSQQIDDLKAALDFSESTLGASSIGLMGSSMGGGSCVDGRGT